MHSCPFDVSNGPFKIGILLMYMLLAGDYDEDLESLIYLFFRLDEVDSLPYHVMPIPLHEQQKWICKTLLGLKHSLVLLQV